MPDRLDVIAMGEALWDLSAAPGRSFAEARALAFEPGGAAVNVALALAGRGFHAGLAAVVGADALGEALAARVAARGVSTTLVQRAPPRTGLVFVERAGAGVRAVSYRAEGEPVPALPRAWSARALVITGLLPGEAQAQSFGTAARAARRRGARVVVDLNARPRMWRGRAPAPPPSWLGEADVVKASEEDLAAMGLDVVGLRAGLRRSAVVIVTAGGGPALAFGPFGTIRRAPRASVEGPAVGAGDAFVAGVCDALLHEAGGLPEGATFWDRVLRRGHALGLSRVTKNRKRQSTLGGETSQAPSTK